LSVDKFHRVKGAGMREGLKRWIVLCAAVAMTLALAACGDDGGDVEEPTAQESESPDATEEETPDGQDSGGEILVTATEYSFDLPAMVAAGETTFTLQNDGEQPHHLILAKLTEDAPPIDELIKMRNPEKFLEEDLSGKKPPHAGPGQTSRTTIEAELTPGTYGYACFIPDAKKKVPHAFLGMYGTFEVQ
jgi:plastocyanin